MARTTEAELIQRREELLLRSAELRRRLGEQTRPLRAPLAVADRTRDGLQWLRAHPQWPAGALLLLLVLKPRRTLRLAGLAWSGWRVVQRARLALRQGGLHL